MIRYLARICDTQMRDLLLQNASFNGSKGFNYSLLDVFTGLISQPRGLCWGEIQRGAINPIENTPDNKMYWIISMNSRIGRKKSVFCIFHDAL